MHRTSLSSSALHPAPGPESLGPKEQSQASRTVKDDPPIEVGWTDSFDPENLEEVPDDQPTRHEFAIDGAGDESDVDTSPPEQIAACARPDLEELVTRSQALAPGTLHPTTEKTVGVLLAVCKDAEAKASVTRIPKQPLDQIREALEKQQQWLDQLKLHQKELEGQPDTADNGSDALPITDILETLKIVHNAIRDTGSVPTQTNMKAVADAIAKVKSTLVKLEKLDDDLKPVPPVLEKAREELQMKLGELQEMQRRLGSYESPESRRRRLEERRVHVDSAHELFSSILRTNVPPQAKGRDAREQVAFDEDAKALQQLMAERSDALRTLAEQAAVDGGTDTSIKVALPDRLTKLLDEEQREALRSVGIQKVDSELALMAAVVDQFIRRHPGIDSRSGKQLLTLARMRVLNERRDWAVIKSDVLVPVAIDANPDASPGAASVAKVKTVTTPAAHLFKHGEIQVVSTGSGIEQKDFDNYLQSDPREPGKNIATGVNSHSTLEHRHGVNVARSELSVDGKLLFGATRHATLSPYELHPDKLRSMSTQALTEICMDLRRSENKVTQICTSEAMATKVRKKEVAGFQPTELDARWSEKLTHLNDEEFIAKARNDASFCALVRRRAALNRAREVFLAEVLHNPALLARIAEGKRICFTSISLITPNLFCHLLGKLLPSKYRKNDELSMRREEIQAWKDLQQAINQGQIEIDGQTVKGTVISVSAGVNELSLENWGPLGRSLLSGWNQVEQENREAMQAMIGDPDSTDEAFEGELGNILRERQERPSLEDNQAPQREIQELRELGNQLRAMWQSGEYRHAGEQPYKFAARIARLSFLMGTGVAFNCKSGKDRTAHLDQETKLLSFQSEYRRGRPQFNLKAKGEQVDQNIVPGYRKRTLLDKLQLQAFIFQDRTRAVMQRYNTGVEGSKLGYWRALYASFIPSLDGEDAQFIGAEFRGGSGRVER